MGWRPWLECAAIAAAYVLPMHAGRQAPRNEPATIRQRAFISLAACCLAWVPMWQALKRHTQVRRHLSEVHPSVHPVVADSASALC